MPQMQNYGVELEVTVRIKKGAGAYESLVASTTVVQEAKANSYDPDRMISPVVHKCIEDAAKQLWKHTLVMETNEAEKLR